MFKKTTLYIVRKDSQDNLQESAPCCDCLEVILKLNIKKIIFSSINNSFKIYRPQDYNIQHQSNGRKHLQRMRS